MAFTGNIFHKKRHLKDIMGEREILKYFFRLAGNHEAEG